jgi:hypothetical protein
MMRRRRRCSRYHAKTERLRGAGTVIRMRSALFGRGVRSAVHFRVERWARHSARSPTSSIRQASFAWLEENEVRASQLDQ